MLLHISFLLLLKLWSNWIIVLFFVLFGGVLWFVGWLVGWLVSECMTFTNPPLVSFYGTGWLCPHIRNELTKLFQPLTSNIFRMTVLTNSIQSPAHNMITPLTWRVLSLLLRETDGFSNLKSGKKVVDTDTRWLMDQATAYRLEGADKKRQWWPILWCSETQDTKGSLIRLM